MAQRSPKTSVDSQLTEMDWEKHGKGGEQVWPAALRRRLSSCWAVGTQGSTPSESAGCTGLSLYIYYITTEDYIRISRLREVQASCVISGLPLLQGSRPMAAPGELAASSGLKGLV